MIDCLQGLILRGKDAKGASLQVTNMRLVNTATKMWIPGAGASPFTFHCVPCYAFSFQCIQFI